MTQPQPMPVTVPELTAHNYRIWCVSLEAYTAQRSVSNYIAGELATPPTNADAHIAKKGEAKLMLLTTISQDIPYSDPHIIYAEIKAHFPEINNPAEHDRLRRKGNSTTIRSGKTLEECIQRPMYLRRDMQHQYGNRYSRWMRQWSRGAGARRGHRGRGPSRERPQGSRLANASASRMFIGQHNADHTMEVHNDGTNAYSTALGSDGSDYYYACDEENNATDGSRPEN